MVVKESFFISTQQCLEIDVKGFFISFSHPEVHRAGFRKTGPNTTDLPVTHCQKPALLRGKSSLPPPVMQNTKKNYSEMLQEIREIGLLGSVSNLLCWDRETYLPEESVSLRAEQMELVGRLSHLRLTDERLWEKVERAAAEPLEEIEKAVLRECRRDIERARKLPSRLVSELDRAITFSQEAWRKARQQNSFNAFKPHLEKILRLKREAGRCLATGDQSEYDALFDSFEPGMSLNAIKPLFEKLKGELIPLIATLREKQAGWPEKLKGPFPVAAQKAIGQKLLKILGFNLKQGRLDTTSHPFCGGTPGDVRLTTRYSESLFRDSFYSTFHEAGHGLYEQGLPEKNRFTPLGEGCSFGIHESQSRFWENMIGRSKSFLEFFHPIFREHLPSAFDGLHAEDLFKIFNRVEPIFLRVHSDEVTYNLHIILRTELEEMLFTDSLDLDDLPEAWNQKMRDTLGLTPPDDPLGVLQDIHWSSGLFSYFPTYTLGNLYAAQWWRQIRREIPNVDGEIASGNLAPVLEWLREKIHRHGRRFPPAELCRRISGEELNETCFLDYLKTKFEI